MSVWVRTQLSKIAAFTPVVMTAGNPALMNLRLMQSLAAAQNSGSTLVFGMPGGFVPLKQTKSAAAGETKEAGGAEV